MKQALLLFTLAIASTFVFPQDVQVREEAVRLMEKADAVSTPLHLPNLERIDTFRVFSYDAPVREGSFSRVVIQGTGRRDETTFGDYHVIDVYTSHGLTTVRTKELAPPEVDNLMHLTPVFHGAFDNEDVIHSIARRDINGRPARCVEFDTITGEKNQTNEICVDADNGTLLVKKVGDERVEYSDYFAFAGAQYPAKISYSFRGALKMEIAQSLTVLTDATANVLAAPPNAQVRQLCKTYRRAFGQSMPQPKSGNGGADTDIILRGMISNDGRIHDAVVQRSERPDLNAEALSLIQQWVFEPALCNGSPNLTEASFELHFRGR
jgi:TonB family protein